MVINFCRANFCFNCSLASIHHLDFLGLSDNRLTATSLPTIIENISYGTLLALDLSFNTMHETGIKALASFFKAKTVVQDVDLANCGITCSDVKALFSVLSMYTNHLEEIRLSCNSIAEEGTTGELFIAVWWAFLSLYLFVSTAIASAVFLRIGISYHTHDCFVIQQPWHSLPLIL